MRDTLAVAKALADENRLRALRALRGRELCVCQIIAFLGLAPSTVSKHMAILHHARLVDSRKKGRWVYYRLAGPRAPAPARQAARWVLKALENDEQARRDDARLRDILKADPEKLCRGQHRR